jgi:hypothetical protein
MLEALQAIEYDLSFDTEPRSSPQTFDFCRMRARGGEVFCRVAIGTFEGSAAAWPAIEITLFDHQRPRQRLASFDGRERRIAVPEFRPDKRRRASGDRTPGSELLLYGLTSRRQKRNRSGRPCDGARRISASRKLGSPSPASSETIVAMSDSGSPWRRSMPRGIWGDHRTAF